MNVTDFGQAAAWLFWFGVVVIVGGVLWASMNRSLKAMTTAMVVIVVGAVLLLAATLAVPTASTTTNTTLVPGASVIYSSGTGTRAAGSTANWSLNSVSHTLTLVTHYDTTNGNYCIPAATASLCTTGWSSAAGEKFTIGVQLSRSDALNTTAGFNIVVSNIPTLTNSTSGITYSPIAYTAATTTSPGIWSISYANGSLNGAKASVNAPSVTTMNADQLGVNAFSGAQATITFTLGGSGFHWLTTAYATYSFTIGVTGGSGATPTSYTVTIITLN